MKKAIIIGICVCVMTFVVTSYGAIGGSAHDFGGDSWSGNRICEACHQPHNSTSTAAPLWARSTPADGYTLYNSSTMVTNPGQPTESKVCLSCHDGSIAMGGSTFMLPSDGAYIGRDLSGNHPIGFSYTTATSSADATIHDPASALSGLPAGGTIADDMLGAGGNLNCMSCHDVHNTAAVGDLLLKSNASSALCTTCHNK